MVRSPLPRYEADRAVVTISLGSRPFVQLTLPLMAAYAEKIGAHFHVVKSRDHEALSDGVKLLTGPLASSQASRFLKLPLLSHFLSRYRRLLYLDDDIVISPAMPDLFRAVPSSHTGAMIERHKPQAWHSMHWSSACEFYPVPGCAPQRWHLFNSGMMLLSRETHGSALRHGWAADVGRLKCRVLCDQLYLNALMTRSSNMADWVSSMTSKPGSRPASAALARRISPHRL